MAIDTTAFPEQGMKETQRLYENNVKPQISAEAPIEGNVSGITAGTTDNTTTQDRTSDQKIQENADATVPETQTAQATTATPSVVQQPQKTIQSGNNTQQKKDNTSKDVTQFNEMEQNRINYAKNKGDISKQIANDVAGELKALGERGGKLDDLTKNQVLAKVMQQYKDQIPQEELAGAMKDINNSVLGLQTVNNRDEVYSKFNKSFKKASNLRNTDVNELAKGLSSGLVTDSQMESLKNIDPAKYDEAYKLKNEIDKSNTRNNILNEKVDSTKSVEKTSPDSYFTREGKDKDKYSNAVGGEGNMLDIYDSMVNTQGVNDAQGEINDLGTKITKLEREKGKLEKTITDEYGTSLSKSALSALIRDRQEPMNEELINLRLTMDGKVNTLNATKAENEKRFGIVMEERQQAQDRYRKNMQFDYKVQMDKYNMNREMSLDERNRYKDQTQMKRNQEDRDYMMSKPTQDQVLASLEGENSAVLASKMRKLELEGGKPVFSFLNDDGTIQLYSKGTGGLDMLETYIPLTPEQKEQKMTMVNYMKSRIGTPYQWGGQSPTGGVDCSGLFMLAGQASGALAPGEDMTAQSMYDKPAAGRDLNNLQEGDPVYFRDSKGNVTHVAAALGPLKNGKIKVIDASGSSGVSERTLSVDKDGKRTGSRDKFTLIGKENFMIAQKQPVQETPSYDKNLGPIYSQYFEGDTPTNAIIEEKGGIGEFAKQATQYYLPIKNKELNTYGYELYDPSLFISGNIDKSKREGIAPALNQYSELKKNISDIQELLSEGGTAKWKMSAQGAKLSQLETNIKLILKGDAGYGLGVLAGPDMEILEDAVKPTVGRNAALRSAESIANDYDGLLTQIEDKINPKLKAMGISKMGISASAAESYANGRQSIDTALDQVLNK